MIFSARHKYWFSALVIGYLYFLAAAASLNGFYEHWHFREEERRSNFAAMYDQTASKPFVYRQFLPRTADVLVKYMPEKMRTSLQVNSMKPSIYVIGETRAHMMVGTADNKRYAVAYIIVYYLCFIGLFVGMICAKLLLNQIGFSSMASLIAPPIFILLFPVFESVGGYFYDCGEVMFVFTFAAVFQLRWGYLAVIPIALVATLNKESFPFYLIASLPLFMNNRVDKRRIFSLALCVVICVVFHLLHIKQFRLNSGAEVEFWLFDTVMFYLNPLHLLNVELIYRIPGLAGYNILLVMTVALFAFTGRKVYSTAMRWYFFVGGCVGFTLAMLFGYPGEVRNLSLLYPALLLFIAAALQRLQFGPERVARLGCAPEWQLLTDWLARRMPSLAVRWVQSFGTARQPEGH